MQFDVRCTKTFPPLPVSQKVLWAYYHLARSLKINGYNRPSIIEGLRIMKLHIHDFAKGLLESHEQMEAAKGTDQESRFLQLRAGAVSNVSLDDELRRIEEFFNVGLHDSYLIIRKIHKIMEKKNLSFQEALDNYDLYTSDPNLFPPPEQTREKLSASEVLFG